MLCHPDAVGYQGGENEVEPVTQHDENMVEERQWHGVAWLEVLCHVDISEFESTHLHHDDCSDDDEEEIDNLLIKAYDAISNETNSNILIFRFENRENPYQKDSKINYSEGSISKKRNSYYIYYGKYYKKIDN